MTLKDKKVLVAGAGKSGIGSANLLIRSGASVSLYDGNEHLKAQDVYDKLEGKKQIPLILGKLGPEEEKEFDLLVLSPGISVNAPVSRQFMESGKPVWSEIELAFHVSRDRLRLSQARMEKQRPQRWWEKS